MAEGGARTGREELKGRKRVKKGMEGKNDGLREGRGSLRGRKEGKEEEGRELREGGGRGKDWKRGVKGRTSIRLGKEGKNCKGRRGNVRKRRG